MSTSSNPLHPDDEFSDDIPDALQEVAQRLQSAINELLVTSAAVVEPFTAAVDSGSGAETSSAEMSIDRRLYLPAAEGWELRVKSGSREHCSRRTPGEDWFHLLVDGELFLQFGDEKFCLNCAYRAGILTDDRLYWQTGHRRQRIFPAGEGELGTEVAE